MEIRQQTHARLLRRLAAGPAGRHAGSSQRTVERTAGELPRIGAVRLARPGHRNFDRGRAHGDQAVRGGRGPGQAALRNQPERVFKKAAAGVPGPEGLRNMRRRAADSRNSGRHDRRTGRPGIRDRNSLLADHRGGGRGSRQARALALAGGNCQGCSPRSPTEAEIFKRGRAGIPAAQPGERHTFRRRSPKDPPRHANRVRALGRDVCPRRAEHRATPARQRPADPDAARPPGSRQFGDRRRAR